MFRALFVVTAFTLVYAKSTLINVKCTSLNCQNISEKLLTWWKPNLNPCDDFYQFACGSFNNSEPLTEQQKTRSNFLILQDKVESDLVEIFKESETEPSSELATAKAQLMMRSCLDPFNNREALGVKPLLQLINSVGGWGLFNESPVGPQSWIDHASIIADYGVFLYFDFKIRSDPMNGSTNAIYLTPPTLEFPTSLINEEHEQMSNEFLKNSLRKSDETQLETPFTYYLLRVATYLTDQQKLNVSEDVLLEKSRAILELMQQLYSAGTKFGIQLAEATVENINSIGTLQQWTEENFPNSTNQIDWLAYLKETFKHSDIELTENTSIYIAGVDAMKSILEILYSVSPQTLSDMVVSRLITYFASQTDSQMENLTNEFYINATMPVAERSRHCLHLIHQPSIGLSLASTYLYVNHFGNDILQQVETMANALKSAFGELVNEAEWLDSSTRSTVLEKLNAMLMMLGYPDEVSSLEKLNLYYQKLNINADDHFGNVIKLRQFSQNFDFNTVGRQRNEQIWSQSPLSINAFYTPLINRLMIPIAIMQDPFFVGNQLGAIDYGRLGSIVGHEITHGFDRNGRSRDKDGNPDISWSNASIEYFNELVSCFESQYNSYIEPLTKREVNGAKTLDENAADNGGLRVAFRAYQRLREINPRFANAQLPEFDDFDGNQLFFLGYASTWCQSASKAGLDDQLTRDSHAPNRFRVVGPLSNMEEFAEAFQCPVGSPMNPTKKCILW